MVMPLTWRYLLAFFCLGTLLGIGHEFAHHFAGYLICGEWGYKTFNSFNLAAGCEARRPHIAWLATLAGPVLFNYIPMWMGFAKLRHAEAGERLLGFSLVLSPLLAAWHVVRNQYRVLVFFLFLVIVPGVVALLFGLVLEPLIVRGLVLPGTLIGIPFLVWLAEAVATIGYWRLKSPLRAPATDADERTLFKRADTPSP